MRGVSVTSIALRSGEKVVKPPLFQSCLLGLWLEEKKLAAVVSWAGLLWVRGEIQGILTDVAPIDRYFRYGDKFPVRTKRSKPANCPSVMWLRSISGG